MLLVGTYHCNATIMAQQQQQQQSFNNNHKQVQVLYNTARRCGHLFAINMIIILMQIKAQYEPLKIKGNKGLTTGEAFVS